MKYIHITEQFYESSLPLESALIGITLDDYYAGKYVLLNDRQCAFIENNTGITPVEAFLMVSSPSVEEIFIQRKKDKLFKVYKYDQSETVNTFFIGETPLWLNRTARAALFNTLTAYKVTGKEQLSLWSTGADPHPITLSSTELEHILISLEIYAKECFDTTSQHKANISKMQTTEEVVGYEHTLGYPEVLRFTIK